MVSPSGRTLSLARKTFPGERSEGGFERTGSQRFVQRNPPRPELFPKGKPPLELSPFPNTPHRPKGRVAKEGTRETPARGLTSGEADPLGARSLGSRMPTLLRGRPQRGTSQGEGSSGDGGQTRQTWLTDDQSGPLRQRVTRRVEGTRTPPKVAAKRGAVPAPAIVWWATDDGALWADRGPVPL